MAGRVVFEGHEIAPDAEEIDLVNVDWPDFAPLVELEHLRVLRLRWTDPHRLPTGFDVDLGPLGRIPTLEVVELADLQVVDLAPLAELPQLRVLDLSSTPVRDLDPLARIASLRDLRLRGTRPRSIAPLQALTGLEHLDVAGSTVDRRELAALRDALPRLAITSS